VGGGGGKKKTGGVVYLGGVEKHPGFVGAGGEGDSTKTKKYRGGLGTQTTPTHKLQPTIKHRGAKRVCV